MDEYLFVSHTAFLTAPPAISGRFESYLPS